MAEKASWATFHLVRLSEPMTAEQLDSADGPEAAVAWLLGRDSALDATGYLRVPASEVWGAMGLFRNRADAEAVLDEPGSALPALASAREAWHCVLAPFNHRGDVNWLERDPVGPAFEPADDPARRGPLVVVTSAGYVIDANIDLDRVRDFVAHTERVRLSMNDTAEGLLVQHVFSHPDVSVDGMTFTVWRNDAAMVDFAYRPGVHREQLDRYRAEHTADRTSFTRFRPVRSLGTWEGRDPLAAADPA